MKHKQYEKIILNDKPLTQQEKNELETHLQTCQSCRTLHAGWVASSQLISHAAPYHPAPGFTTRWQQTIIKKRQVEKVRRYRLSIFILSVLAFAGAVAYMVISGSVMQSLANGFAFLSNLMIKVTNGLSTLGYWTQSVPIIIPLIVGFLLFGLFSAFMMSGIFFIWNLNRRELALNEIKAN
jgi:hypothetical protein